MELRRASRVVARAFAVIAAPAPESTLSPCSAGQAFARRELAPAFASGGDATIGLNESTSQRVAGGDASVISYPRQQQYRRLGRSAAAASAALATGLLALLAGSVGAAPVAGALLIATAVLAEYARHWGRLAARSRVGARSEGQVRRALEPVRGEGWRLRHAVPWQGRGDIDHVAIAPRDVGLAFAIETKNEDLPGRARGSRRGDRALAGVAAATLVPARRPAGRVPRASARG
jgi:hypothetical protein